MVGLLLIVGGGVVVGSAIASNKAGSIGAETTGNEADNEASNETTGVDSEESETDVGNESTSQPTATAKPPTKVEFTSKSGNIRCRMEESGVTCHMGEFTYTKPSEACKSGLAGVTVGLDQAGIVWPCLAGDIKTSKVLAYDTNLNAFNYDCSINFTTGVTCVNASKVGFQMEYDAGIILFG